MPVRRGARGRYETWILTGPHAEAEVCPARGALVTRLRASDDEVLYLDEATFLDPFKNVRGGVPLLFPVAGPPPEGSKLKQHGFARSSAWEAQPDGETLRLTLSASEDTHRVFPFEFRIDYSVELVGERLELRWLIHNRDVKPMPLHFGVHPYFRVPVETKRRARIETAATRAFDNRSKTTGPLPALDFGGDELDLHLLDHAAKSTVLDRGDGTRVPLSWSHSFETLVLWTLPGQGFVCVEPWSGPSVLALQGERPALAAGGSASFAFVVGR
jgi:galactose mutarotase-like enzyme